MGFFSSDNSRTWFLGIWYKKVSTRTVIWIANRDTPLSDTSSTVLKFNEKGILSLMNNTNSTLWSANSSRTTQNPVAQLLESGNLVVVGENGDDPDNYPWQSFDHPTDTFMAGMKLGVNLVTGVNRVISNGKYAFRVDPHGFPQAFLEKDSVKQFRSGPWNGVSFSGTPGLKPNNIYKYDFVFNKEEVYYIYWLIDSSVYSRMVLNEIGVVKRFTWNQRTQEWGVYLSEPQDNCDFFGLCYGYSSCNMNKSPICGCLDKFVPKNEKDWDRTDWSSGCVRRTPLDCKNGDGFVKYSGIKVPDTSHSWYDMKMNLEECKNMCLKNCTCMAYANSDIRGRGSGCLLWFEDLMDIRVLTESGQDIYIRMASSELDSTGSNNKKKWKRMGIGLALLAVVLLAVLSLMYTRKRKKKKAKKQQKQQLLEHLQKERNIESQTEDLELPMFNLATISDATMNFSVDNKIGEGGFGPVYKGMLEEGQEIAVKRLSLYSAQGLDEFKNEVVCITKLQHRNLVRLLGCCIQGQENMLIYEYMPNNSLDSFLFDHTRSKLLDWPKRFNIIIGTARGLLYLHQDSRIRIIHRDLKAANILLDKDMNPKISDFGMARSFGGNETAANTKRVVGTYGYMSPEYAGDGIFSVKSDVFSFGVLVLEIVSGRRNRRFSHPDHHHNLLGHAWLLFEEGRSLELIDANLSDTCYVLELLRSIHVGLLCVQQHPEDRPSMSSVVHMLGNEGALPRPKEPGFFTKRNLVFEVDYTSSSNAQFSANEISNTLLEAR